MKQCGGKGIRKYLKELFEVEDWRRGLKKNGKRSVFQSRTAMKLIPKIVNAAKFLVKYELI